MAVISVGMSPKCKRETCSSSTTKSPAVMRLAMVRFRPGLSANSFPYCSRIPHHLLALEHRRAVEEHHGGVVGIGTTDRSTSLAR